MFKTLNKKSFGPFIGIDVVFVALAAIAAMATWQHASKGAQMVAPIADQDLFVVTALVAIVGLSLLATVVLRIDRKLNDEYAFQAMTLSATSAILVTLVANMVLDIIALDGAEPIVATSDLLLAILTGSWATGYAFYRVRGTHP